MKEAKFTIESLPGYVFSGFTNKEDWNGWACPYFEFEEAVRIKNAHNESGLLDAYYDEENDAFVFEFPDEPETYASMEIRGKKLYPVGNAAWIWEEADNG